VTPKDQFMWLTLASQKIPIYKQKLEEMVNLQLQNVNLYIEWTKSSGWCF